MNIRMVQVECPACGYSMAVKRCKTKFNKPASSWVRITDVGICPNCFQQVFVSALIKENVLEENDEY